MRAIRLITSMSAMRCGSGISSKRRPSVFAKCWSAIRTTADARLLLSRCEKQSGPRAGRCGTEALERVKSNYEESAWWQLKAALQPQKK